MWMQMDFDLCPVVGDLMHIAKANTVANPIMCSCSSGAITLDIHKETD